MIRGFKFGLPMFFSSAFELMTEIPTTANHPRELLMKETTYTTATTLKKSSTPLFVFNN